jgi:hypothetical protein
MIDLPPRDVQGFFIDFILPHQDAGTGGGQMRDEFEEWTEERARRRRPAKRTAPRKARIGADAEDDDGYARRRRP